MKQIPLVISEIHITQSLKEPFSSLKDLIAIIKEETQKAFMKN